MKKQKRYIRTVSVILFALGIPALSGCGENKDIDAQADAAVQYVILEEYTGSVSAQMQDDAQEQDAALNGKTQEQDVALNGKTQEQMDLEDLTERAMLEEKVQSAGGISEEEALEIAKETMKTDIGIRCETMKLHIESVHGWSSFLRDITDWNEYNDRGETAYFFQFDDIEDGLYSYHCVVNAADGSILGAYGLTLPYDNVEYALVYYEH